jgi:hypothetical protein
VRSDRGDYELSRTLGTGSTVIRPLTFATVLDGGVAWQGVECPKMCSGPVGMVID